MTRLEALERVAARAAELVELQDVVRDSERSIHNTEIARRNMKHAGLDLRRALIDLSMVPR